MVHRLCWMEVRSLSIMVHRVCRMELTDGSSYVATCVLDGTD